MQKIPRIEDIWLDDVRHAPPHLLDFQATQLIGAPDDRAIQNVGGRLGAKQGPLALRELLGKMMTGLQPGIQKIRFGRGIDIAPGASIEDAHKELRAETSALLKAGALPIIIGGGHDFGYPHVAGAHDVYGEQLAVVNIDAHLDVRPLQDKKISSGSPFFMAIENKVLNPKFFHEFGIQEHCNFPEALEYLKKKGTSISFLNKLQASKTGVLGNFEKVLQGFVKAKKQILVSFDVDAVNSAWAPGVSSPQADGFSSGEFLAMVRTSALCPNVCTLGFFELSPPLDESEKTTKLVATAVHQFISYFGLRKKKQQRPKLRVSPSRRGH